MIILYLFSNGIGDIAPSLVDCTIWAPGSDKQQLSECVERALVSIWNRSILWGLGVKPYLPSFARLVICNLWQIITSTRKSRVLLVVT